MEPGAVVTVAIIVVAIVAVWLLPMRKRWNDDGADDARRRSVEQEIRADPPDTDVDDDASRHGPRDPEAT